MRMTAQQWVDLAGITILTGIFFVLVRFLRRRMYQRMATLAFVLLACGWGIYTGDRWEVLMIPLKYWAYGLTGLLVIFMLTGQLFRGGPLDPRDDGPEEET